MKGLLGSELAQVNTAVANARRKDEVRTLMLGLLREIRSQHGREHATVAVLLERGISPPLAGNATPGGFLVYSRASTEDVREAAEEALRRLQSGQHGLAVSPYCGTNILVAALIALIVTSVLRGRSKSVMKGMSSMMLGIMVALTFRRRVGELVQEHLTTLPDSDGVSVRQSQMPADRRDDRPLGWHRTILSLT